MGTIRMPPLSHAKQGRIWPSDCSLMSAKHRQVHSLGERRTTLVQKGLAMCSLAGRDKALEWVLALDVGTGGTKAALVSSSGLVAATAFSQHPAPEPSSIGGPGSLEQDQECWWSATIAAVTDCISSSGAKSHHVTTTHIGAIAVTGQMQDVIILPKNVSSSKYKAIMYSDTRAVEEAEEITHLAGGSDSLATITGTHQGPSSLLAKLRWIDKHIPEARSELLFGGHDYVTWKLCGAAVTDATTASTTGLTNTSSEYADDLLETVGLRHWMTQLPKIYPSDVPCGQVSESAAQEFGLRGLQGIPVFHCCGDAGACTLGCRIPWLSVCVSRDVRVGWRLIPKISGGQCCEANSGSIQPWASRSSFALQDRCHYDSWWKCQLGVIHGSPLQHFDQLAISAQAGSGGLLFLPYLNGERCPFDDENVRASFIGISASTTKAEMFRAVLCSKLKSLPAAFAEVQVLEGICFALRSGRDAVLGEHCHEKLPPLRLVGGGARSPLWPDILSNVFGQSVEVLQDSQEAGVKGAALLAGKWLGWHTSLSPEGQWIQVERVCHPCRTDSEHYNTLYATYARASGDLSQIFKELSTFRKESAS